MGQVFEDINIYLSLSFPPMYHVWRVVTATERDIYAVFPGNRRPVRKTLPIQRSKFEWRVRLNRVDRPQR